ncbi:hypothetical protein PC116_g15101 [Phytophthora cactorum]|nr:hypothetical protein Pcac1_g15774 [Phytophthora cactorum]KAG4236816.1 hypothetical protein PC116_g15101 [Phytophthora cactorum]
MILVAPMSPVQPSFIALTVYPLCHLLQLTNATQQFVTHGKL